MEDMEIKEVEEKKNIIKRVTDWLYGGIRMSWIKVILFAVVIAAVTAVFMIFPVFENTSFHNMGVTFEAWFFFAIIIMANCQSPIE